jgi:hypothetical protein
MATKPAEKEDFPIGSGIHFHWANIIAFSLLWGGSRSN